jgi:hypothetical protein
MAGYTNCKVGEVQKVTAGYGFVIRDGYKRLVVTFAFATEADAAQARAEIEKVVAKAIEITPQGLWAHT